MIVLQSLPHLEILKNKNIIYNNTYSLLKDLYKDIKNDLQSHNYNININKYQQDIENILMIIYRKLYAKNIKMIENVKFVNKKSQPSLYKPQKEKLQNNIHDNIDKLMDSQAYERSLLLLNGLTDGINDVIKSSEYSYTITLQNLNKQILDINMKLNKFPPFINSNTLSYEYSQLQKKLNKLTNEREKLINNKSDYIDKTMSMKYDKEIVNTKAELHTINEIDNFDSLQQELESSTIDEFFKFSLLIDSDQNMYKLTDKFKTWLNPLDKDSRKWHAKLHGTTISENDVFILYNPQSGQTEEAYMPRDYNLSAENSINCRCQLNRSKTFNQV